MARCDLIVVRQWHKWIGLHHDFGRLLSFGRAHPLKCENANRIARGGSSRESGSSLERARQLISFKLDRGLSWLAPQNRSDVHSKVRFVYERWKGVDQIGADVCKWEKKTSCCCQRITGPAEAENRVSRPWFNCRHVGFCLRKLHWQFGSKLIDRFDSKLHPKTSPLGGQRVLHFSS